jgi:Spx/MgsR family transcriptional regulator
LSRKAENPWRAAPLARSATPEPLQKCKNHNMITLYGIPNCDTVKKARAWLSENGLTHAFHDFKKQGIAPEQLALWTQAAGWEKLLNRKGTTWRKLDAQAQAAVVDAASAQSLMLANPGMIKRPVVDWGQDITVGFDAAAWAERV